MENKNNFRVIATRKTFPAETMVVFGPTTEEKADRFCEQWGWTYDDGKCSYWLSVEVM